MKKSKVIAKILKRIEHYDNDPSYEDLMNDFMSLLYIWDTSDRHTMLGADTIFDAVKIGQDGTDPTYYLDGEMLYISEDGDKPLISFSKKNDLKLSFE